MMASTRIVLAALGLAGWVSAPAASTKCVTVQDCATCPEMIVIPAGSFLMGNQRGNGEKNELPVHREHIAYKFAIGKFPVTFSEWDACVKEGGCRYKPDDAGWGRGRHPVINVSWNDIQEYLGWLSRKTKAAYRLPSEAEWEYVARAGTTTPYHYGNNPDHDQMNYGRREPGGTGHSSLQGVISGRDRWLNTSPVGSFPPNGFGVYDMHGNVWEWVQDCLSVIDNYERSPGDGSAWESEPGETRCNTGERRLRGGAWNFPGQYATSFFRGARRMDERRHDFGFRVVRSLPSR